ncbi:MAG: hypothetical protein SNJ56_01600 [Termitinemataceae bacterium]
MKQYNIFVLLLFVAMTAAFGQRPGMYSSEGRGRGATREAALEAAKIEAVNTMVYTILRRDTLYRDLFISEALRNGWVQEQRVQKIIPTSWEALVVLQVDEGLAEALYVGRYSTTLSSLLDQAEQDLQLIGPLMDQALHAESQGNLGNAETYFSQAEAKALSVLHLLDPVEDAYFFSSIGKRKAPELKLLAASYVQDSRLGIDRLRTAQKLLTVNQATQQVLTIFDQVEQDLKIIESKFESLVPVIGSPRSQTIASLNAGLGLAKNLQSALTVQKRQFAMIVQDEGLKVFEHSGTYLDKRRDILAVKIQSLDRQLSRAQQTIQCELFWRSRSVKAALWILDHEPSQYLSVGFQLPGGVYPSPQGPQGISVPFQLSVKGEGSVFLGRGGLWGRSSVVAGQDSRSGGYPTFISQEIALGGFRNNLFGLGVSWDWFREDHALITAVQFVWGISGDALGRGKPLPLWENTISWEIPRGSFHTLGYVNLGWESVLRPSKWIQIDSRIDSRLRSYKGAIAGSDLGYWVGSAHLCFALQLPVLRPFQWMFGWDGLVSAPLTELGVDSGGLQTHAAFTFGLGYVF